MLKFLCTLGGNLANLNENKPGCESDKMTLLSDL